VLFTKVLSGLPVMNIGIHDSKEYIIAGSSNVKGIEKKLAEIQSQQIGQ
jgi:hypothetical protein